MLAGVVGSTAARVLGSKFGGGTFNDRVLEYIVEIEIKR